MEKEQTYIIGIIAIVALVAVIGLIINSGNMGFSISNAENLAGNAKMSLSSTKNTESTDTVTATKSARPKKPVNPALCINECTPFGAQECINNDSFRVCGNFDSDPCYEWGTPQYCGGNETCVQNGTQAWCEETDLACTCNIHSNQEPFELVNTYDISRLPGESCDSYNWETDTYIRFCFPDYSVYGYQDFNCQDLDGGIEPTIPSGVTYNRAYVNGNVEDLGYDDSCIGNSLRELYCHTDGRYRVEWIACENGCDAGACIENETNETLLPDFTIVDIYPTMFFLENMTNTTNSTIIVQVRNLGDAPGTANLFFTINETNGSTNIIYSTNYYYNAGQNRYLSYDINLPNAGTYTAYAVLDRFGNVVESNENNNERTEIVYVLS